MRNSRIFLKRVAIALSALLLVSAIGVAQVTVSLPTVTYKLGTTQTIPITVGDLTGKAAIAFQTVVTYDKNILKMTGVTSTSTLSSALPQQSVNNDTANGRITIAAAGTSAMSGGGTLIYLNATMVGKGTSPLTFTSFQFNEGDPASTLTSGQVTVPVLSVKISDITVDATAGTPITLPITTEDLTGKNVLAYQFTVTFDSTKIKLTGASLYHTLSGGFQAPVVNTATSGQLRVAVAGTAALTGTGTLVNLTGTVVAAGTSAVSFTAFQYNEGSPSGGGVDGSVTVGAGQKPVLVSRTPANVSLISRNTIANFVVSAKDQNVPPSALQYTWKVNGVAVKGPGVDSTYTTTFTDPHGTAKTVTCVFTNTAALSDSTTWSFIITAVEPIDIPTDFNLAQNYPNPFNPTTMITFSLPKEAPVAFEIYNMLGVKIRTLMAGETKSAGVHSVTWDGKDNSGINMPSGVYLYRIQAGTFLASKKMTLLK